VGFAEPPQVLNDPVRDSSVDYETLDLSSLSQPQTSRVILRVFFWDSAPGAMVNVLLRAANSAGAPAEAFTVWSNQYGRRR